MARKAAQREAKGAPWGLWDVMAEQYLAQTQQQRMQMVLAPQLRQSLEMLQVPIMELQTLIQQEIQQNPTLEEQITDAKDRIEVEPIADEKEDENPLNNEFSDFEEQFEALAKIDDEWREHFRQSTTSYSSDDAARRQFFMDSLSQPESLQEHLLNQLMLAELPEDEKNIGEMLIGSINEDGYLTLDLNELTETMGYDHDQVDHVLHLIREFDPVGVGSSDLRDCLLIQLERLGKGESLAFTIVDQHLRALAAHKYAEIARALKVPPEEVHQAARFIATLEPKPGRSFISSAPTYVLPEVVVNKENGAYNIQLDNDQIPHLRISRHYRNLMQDPNTSTEVKAYIRDKIRAGEFLIKSIGQRQDTIGRIAREIVAVQTEFMEQGVSALRPLTMAEIADKLGIHETTVSRAIANKYIETPRGVFEMKYFFTPGFKSADGTEVSNKTIKDAISQLVANEDPAAPLSDQAMVVQLKERGIKVARRTIAKYREELKILPSHLRRSM